jgi:MtN3 and saliva related transmembrane protein
MENAQTLIGIGASIFTGIALLPQLIKIIKEKDAGGVSPLMLISLFIGLVLWVIYGCYKNDWIIILANGFALLVNTAIAVLALYYRWLRKP